MADPLGKVQCRASSARLPTFRCGPRRVSSHCHGMMLPALPIKSKRNKSYFGPAGIRRKRSGKQYPPFLGDIALIGLF